MFNAWLNGVSSHAFPIARQLASFCSLRFTCFASFNFASFLWLSTWISEGTKYTYSKGFLVFGLFSPVIRWRGLSSWLYTRIDDIHTIQLEWVRSRATKFYYLGNIVILTILLISSPCVDMKYGNFYRQTFVSDSVYFMIDLLELCIEIILPWLNRNDTKSIILNIIRRPNC